VVLDATFIDPALRGRAEQLARDCGVRFHAVWLEAPLETLKGRVAARTGDASDATLETLDDQLARLKGEAAWTHVDTSVSIESAARAWLAGLAKA
jgi:predicted kinase